MTETAIEHEEDKVRWIISDLFKHPAARIAVPFLLLLLGAFVLAPLIAPMDPNQQELGNALARPNALHWLGTDQYGRDLFSRIVWGGRYSFAIAGLGVGAAAATGSIIGIIGAFIGGRIDRLFVSLLDTILAFPPLLLALTLMVVLGRSAVNVAVALAISLIPTFARVLRSAVVSLRESDFISAARAFGAPSGYIMARHVVPNIFGTVIVLASITLPRAILLESNLSFLGVGAPITTPTLGLMVSEGIRYLQSAPYVSLVPGMAIILSVYAVNLVGDALRDIWDPQVGGRRR